MNVRILLLLGIIMVGCRSKDVPLPILYVTIDDAAAFDDFVYTNNGYLLIFKNYNKDARDFSLFLKSDNKQLPMQPVFPLSLRDSLFSSNLIYSLVGKEGESWLLFDKTSQKKDSPKRYKLIKYDFLSRTTLKTYFILPIHGRSFANVSELQIDEKNEMMYYADNDKNDIVSINMVDGTMKSFSFSANASVNPILSSMKIVQKDSINQSTPLKLALNKDRSLLFIIELKKGNLYSIKEEYIINKQFYSQDILSQIMLVENDLQDVVDVEFDRRARPIVATRNSIYLIRNNDKKTIVKDFKYGDITAISYTNNRVYFSVKSNKYNIYYIDMVR